MALTSGTRLGPYEIQSPLGTGGMGEVYCARDTRLDRTVAIKILPAHLSDNREAKQRFDHEARAISSLNHPNICALYDVGQQDGTNYLVMEFLAGQTLAERLMKGPLPLEQVLKTKADVVTFVKKSFADGAAAIQRRGDSGMAELVNDPNSHQQVRVVDLAYGIIEHSGEHYGQLVVYYRVAGLVPPESRPKK
jgi:serine/threonine protein kinase